MRFRPVVVMVVAALALAVPAVAVAVPPTLTGEHFHGTFSESVGLCDLANPEIHYHVSGDATGSYSGTFNETGVIVITPAGASTGAPLIDLDARFTIDSPVGQVVGEKHFVGTSSGLGQCTDVGGSPLTKLKTAKGEDLQYRAAIRTGPGILTGLWIDCGISDLFFTQNTAPPPIQAFGEDFASTLKSPVPWWTILFGPRPCG